MGVDEPHKDERPRSMMTTYGGMIMSAHAHLQSLPARRTRNGRMSDYNRDRNVDSLVDERLEDDEYDEFGMKTTVTSPVAWLETSWTFGASPTKYDDRWISPPISVNHLSSMTRLEHFTILSLSLASATPRPNRAALNASAPVRLSTVNSIFMRNGLKYRD